MLLLPLSVMSKFATHREKIRKTASLRSLFPREKFSFVSSKVQAEVKSIDPKSFSGEATGHSWNTAGVSRTSNSAVTTRSLKLDQSHTLASLSSSSFDFRAVFFLPLMFKLVLTFCSISFTIEVRRKQYILTALRYSFASSEVLLTFDKDRNKLDNPCVRASVIFWTALPLSSLSLLPQVTEYRESKFWWSMMSLLLYLSRSLTPETKLSSCDSAI
mmetsp:Transcript_31847/g.62208  ORF Transcript_31847/g.62208 Transcript_31847/m.62208 type:complete len:216 (+) Transcript_31847:3910-4557(+)